MKRSSLVSLVITLSAFGIYFLAIDPLFASNRWAAFLTFMLVFAFCRFIEQKLRGRFAFLDKRIDMQLSVLIVFGLLVFFPLLINALE